MIPKHMYRYFVYYQFKKDGSCGYGNCETHRKCRILTIADVKDVEASLERDCSLDIVTLTNYIFMK